MKTNQVHEAKALKGLSRVFSRQKGRGSRTYPEDLRRLVRKAREQGHSISALSTATGVSYQGVRNWLVGVNASEKRQSPVELKVVDSPRVSGLIHPRAEADESLVVTVRFRSGAVLELPLSRFNTDIVNALNGSES